MYAGTRACPHTYVHACIRSYAHADAHAYTQTRVYALHMLQNLQALHTLHTPHTTHAFQNIYKTLHRSNALDTLHAPYTAHAVHAPHTLHASHTDHTLHTSHTRTMPGGFRQETKQISYRTGALVVYQRGKLQTPTVGPKHSVTRLPEQHLRVEATPPPPEPPGQPEPP